MEVVLNYLNVQFMVLLIMLTEGIMRVPFVSERISPKIVNKVVATVLVLVFFRFNLEEVDQASVLISYAFSIVVYDDVIDTVKNWLGFGNKD